MAVKGNYRQRDERLTFADYNKAWSAKRRRAIQEGQQLRQAVSLTVFTNSNRIFQARPTADAQGVYASTTAIMARVNILV